MTPFDPLWLIFLAVPLALLPAGGAFVIVTKAIEHWRHKGE